MKFSEQLEDYLKHLRDIKTTRAGRFMTPDRDKYAVCPYCSRLWLTSRKGGGMVVQAANRHVKACPNNPNKE